MAAKGSPAWQVYRRRRRSGEEGKTGGGGWAGEEKERRGELDSLGVAESLQWTGAKKGKREKRKKGVT